MTANSKDIIDIDPISQEIDHKMNIIGSKSLSHRALVIAALAPGTSCIKHISNCEDVAITTEALKQCGVKFDRSTEGLLVKGLNGKLKIANSTLKFENSGTSYRLFMGLACLMGGPMTLEGNARMRSRPIKELAEILKMGQVNVTYLGEEGYPPVQICGNFQGGRYKITSASSSQFTSALLLISPFNNSDLELESTGTLRSVPYIQMTCEMMKSAGIQMVAEFSSSKIRIKVPCNQTYNRMDQEIEGDYSGAAFFLVAAAILGGRIKIGGLKQDSIQGDKAIVDYLSKMGCECTYFGDSLQLVKHNHEMLAPLTADLGDHPDLVMPLAIAALFASGTSKFTNIEHLRLKESDRLALLHRLLLQVGAKSEITQDSISIHPTSNYTGISVDPQDDHRIAMCFAILGLKVAGMQIQNDNCVNKSFPSFFAELDTLRRNIQDVGINAE